nr:uncharacterized protein CI109_003918 [Kwoniella shandongensis]KAA5527659.1 hypothetical protein CI109_003918 [Kwoniella shandongensis]
MPPLPNLGNEYIEPDEYVGDPSPRIHGVEIPYGCPSRKVDLMDPPKEFLDQENAIYEDQSQASSKGAVSTSTESRLTTRPDVISASSAETATSTTQDLAAIHTGNTTTGSTTTGTTDASTQTTETNAVNTPPQSPLPSPSPPTDPSSNISTNG